MSKLRRYKRQRVFAMPLRDAAGMIGITVPSNMTLEDAVRLGMDIKMVPKDQPLGPNSYHFDYERDMPEDD